MKRSIKHLPKRTQEELSVLLELIQKHIPWCCMIALYGSYARGGYVLWDAKVEFGNNTSYQSDLDIMVVCPKANTKHTEDKLRTKVTEKYHNVFKNRRHASPQFIVEHIDKLNNQLDVSQYFFTDVVKDCIILYNNGEHKLAKPRNLSYKEIKKIAEDEYSVKMKRGNEFIELGHTTLEKEYYINGSYQLHQACERYYNAISLVFTNYQPKSHKINELAAQLKSYSRELANIFPQYRINRKPETFEQHCYNLLCKAYIESRYNKDFAVTKEELEQMLKWTEELKTITEKICKERIEWYDLQIKQEEINNNKK